MLISIIIGQANPESMSSWELAVNAGPMVKFILILLVVVSILCWATIVFKAIQLRRAKSESTQFLKSFWAGESLDQVVVSTKRFKHTPLAHVFRAGMHELDQLRRGRKRDEESSLIDMSRQEMGIENVERTLSQSGGAEIERLTRFLSFLATTGSTAPFIGLFGTVWGIMGSFQSISAMKGGAGIDVVGQGISEALIATAAGLAAAIPAVVAYNYFLSMIRSIQTDLMNFQSEFINIIERHYLKKRSRQRRPDDGPGHLR